MTVNKITKAPTQNEIIDAVNDLIDNKQDTLIAGTDLEIINAVTPLLPTGYTELEYIEGTGTQYIDTGYYGTQNSGAYIRFALTDLTSEGSARVFGTRNGTGGTGAFAFISSYNGSSLPSDKFYIGSNGYASWSTNLDTNWHEVSCNIENDKKVYFDGNLIITGSDTAYTSNGQTSIFRTYNRTAYSAAATAKISIVQIYENAVMIHNFIPCRRDSDDELGMYDLVSDTFFTNSGTGTFTGGPEVIYPTTTTINFTNDSGYTTNVGTVTSVNNTQPDANGNVTLTIPTANDGVLTITQNGTSKGTFSANQSTNGTIALTDTTYNAFTGADGTNAGSSGLVPAPSATDNDKYLKGDGTWASVSGGSSTDVQINGTSITSGGVANIVTNSAYDASSNKIATMSDLPASGANTDLSNLTATGEAHFLKNNTTAGSALSLLGSSTTGYGSISIGTESSATNSGIAIGYGESGHSSTTATGVNSIALGVNAKATARCSIQLGSGTNSTANSLYFGSYVNNQIQNYQLLDGTTGLIPDARISKQTSITSSSTDTQIPSAKAVIELLKTIYPVGSVYLSTNSTCPLSSLFGTWTLVSSGKALWTGTGSNGNTTIAAGLPNIKGKIQGETPTLSGAFTLSSSFSTKNTVGSTGSGAPTRGEISFSAASSNSIYSDSVTTVQPPAYVVNVWRRTA